MTRSAVARTAPSRPARAAPTLRPVEPPRPSGEQRSRWARIRSRLNPVGVASVIVAVCLLGVVVGNMQLAAGQLRLSQLEAEVVALQSSQSALRSHDAALISPSAIAHDVKGKGQPSYIYHIPTVSLVKRLGPPRFSYLPCCTITPGR